MIIDTDILIDYFRGKKQAQKQIFSVESRSISMVTQFELFQGTRDKKELNLLKQFIREWSFKIYSIDETISFGTLFLLEKYSLSYGLKMVDALIAAIAINYDEELITGNYKDFKFIKEINVKKYDDPESVRI